MSGFNLLIKDHFVDPENSGDTTTTNRSVDIKPVAGSTNPTPESNSTTDYMSRQEYIATTARNISYLPLHDVHEKNERFSQHQFVLFIGSGISMAAIMIVLFTYTTSRKFRVKRPHMITINLCVSLLVFYIGILLTATYMDHDHEENQAANKSISAGCTAGAIFFELGTLYSWTWITAHWAYLTYTIYSVAAPHISHFFIKVTLPAYGLPTLLACFILLGNTSMGDSLINRGTCFFNMDEYLVGTINFSYIGICIVLIASCITYCIMRLTCKKNKNQVVSTYMRIKMSVIRLGVITTGVVATFVPELIRWVMSDDTRRATVEIFNGVVLGAVGIIVVIGLLFRRKEFRIHLMQGKPSKRNIFRRAANNIRNIKRRPGSISKPVREEKVRSPEKVRSAKLIPRESQRNVSRGNQNPASLFPFPPLEEKATPANSNVVEKTSRSGGETSKQILNVPTKTHVNDTTFQEKDLSTTLEKTGKSRNDTLSRMSSLRKIVLRGSTKRSSRKIERNPSTVQSNSEENKEIERKESPDIAENEEDEISLGSSIDIYRKTSF